MVVAPIILNVILSLEITFLDHGNGHGQGNDCVSINVAIMGWSKRYCVSLYVNLFVVDLTHSTGAAVYGENNFEQGGFCCSSQIGERIFGYPALHFFSDPVQNFTPPLVFPHSWEIAWPKSSYFLFFVYLLDTLCFRLYFRVFSAKNDENRKQNCGKVRAKIMGFLRFSGENCFSTEYSEGNIFLTLYPLVFLTLVRRRRGWSLPFPFTPLVELCAYLGFLTKIYLSPARICYGKCPMNEGP